MFYSVDSSKLVPHRGIRKSLQASNMYSSRTTSIFQTRIPTSPQNQWQLGWLFSRVISNYLLGNQ